MLIIEVERLMENGDKISINLNCAGIDFIGNHVKKEFKDTSVVAMHNGVVLHLNIRRNNLVKIMSAYK